MDRQSKLQPICTLDVALRFLDDSSAVAQLAGIEQLARFDVIEDPGKRKVVLGKVVGLRATSSLVVRDNARSLLGRYGALAFPAFAMWLLQAAKARQQRDAPPQNTVLFRVLQTLRSLAADAPPLTAVPSELVERVGELLEFPDNDVRLAAAAVLETLPFTAGSAAFAHVFVWWLTDTLHPAYPFAAQAMRNLVVIGAPALSQVLLAARQPELIMEQAKVQVTPERIDLVRHRALVLLGNIPGAKAALPFISSQLKGAQNIRQMAAQVLFLLGLTDGAVAVDETVWENVTTEIAQGSRETSTRQYLVDAVANLGRASVNLLRETLDTNRNRNVRLALLRALRCVELRDRGACHSAKDTLWRILLEETDQDMLGCLVLALGALGSHAKRKCWWTTLTNLEARANPSLRQAVHTAREAIEHDNPQLICERYEGGSAARRAA